jgi:lipopolysaccharide/colanic/teichoic acid biosynthesis glycosyltransferase
VSTESYVPKASELARIKRTAPRSASDGSDSGAKFVAGPKHRLVTDPSHMLFGKHLSPWSGSRSKRVFDCACVISMLPVLIPVFMLVGLAVRITSRGPVLFLQKRMGRHGREFTILKFRTMIHASERAHHPVTTSGNQQFTPVGPFLRRWKLDEVPQLFNVLAGHMSLVGPRPKLPAHAISNVPCRAGITGAATIAFAREETILDLVPKHHLEAFYHSVVLPTKHQLDEDYMASATFASDLKLIIDSVLRRWDTVVIERLLKTWAYEQGDRRMLSNMAEPEDALAHPTLVPHMDRPATPKEMRAY